MDASASTPSTYSSLNLNRPSINVLGAPRTASLNERLNTDYVDIGEDEDRIDAQLTKRITDFVGQFVTPRQLLIVLRILKAMTFCFLILTVAADLMYIVFLEVLADREVKELAGGRRDMTIRIYGLMLAAIAICVELDYATVVKSFYGFKGFIPRSFLIYFVSAITGAHPLHAAVAQPAGDDDAVYVDDMVDDGYSTSVEIPGSAVVFQMVTSFML